MEELTLLIMRAQANDKDAFGAIVRRFQDMAVGYAYSILSDFYLAQDAAQEAFIDAYYNLVELRAPAAFPGWFRRIVFKHCNRFTRGQRLEVVSLDAAANVPAGDPDPAAIASAEEFCEQVQAAIAGLPEKQREVTTLFYINGYSQVEIADFLEVSAPTIRKRLQYARARLKKEMLPMVKDHLQENRPSQDETFVTRVLLEESFDDAQRVKETWQDVPDLSLQDGKLNLTHQYLFVIDRKHERGLNTSNVTDELRGVFANHNISLSEKTKITVNPDAQHERWFIADEPHQQAYRILYPWYDADGHDIDNELWVYSSANYEKPCEDAVITESREFVDFEMSVDFYIVSMTAGFVVRAQDQRNYYMFQYDLRSVCSNVIEFHIWTDQRQDRWPEKDQNRNHLNHYIPAAVMPELQKWYRVKIVAQGFKFAVYLGTCDDDLQLAAEWEDLYQTFRKGSIGFWNQVGSGESAIYDNLVVREIK